MRRRRRQKTLKPIEEPTFLVDLSIYDQKLVEALREIGLRVVGFFEAFVDQETPDSEIIRRCDKENWVLITADKDIEASHFPLIKTTRVAILILSNNQDTGKKWAQALVRAKPSIERHLKKTPRPFTARIGTTGRIYLLRIIRKTDKSIADSQLPIAPNKKRESIKRY